MAAAVWWEGETGERFWLESTDRHDVGADLRAPAVDQRGKDNWRYSLFKLAKPGDVVFHYYKPTQAILGFSKVAGPWASRPIVWGARGTSAREKGIVPHERPGFWIPLAGFTKLAEPLTLQTLRKRSGDLRKIEAALRKEHPKHPLYFPFSLDGARPVRPLQGYGFKLPREFVSAFSLLELAPDPEWVPGPPLVPQRRPATGQGFAPQELKEAVERLAMAAAIRLFRKRGYKVTNVCRTASYDLRADSENEVLFIEVKGTTGGGDAVFLTKNEVRIAQEMPERAVLFVLHSIRTKKYGARLIASGGTQALYEPWNLEYDRLEALQYRYVLG